MDNLLGIFCATFTADILWFLSSYEVPKYLPVTVACHNSERCWSRCDDQRWSRPYTDWPNLTVVYPPFPDTVAFAKGKRQGVGCHHPKIFLLHRRDIMRVIITSANLVPNQWFHVTNTVWWQDFPRRSTRDYLSLFSPAILGSKNIVIGDFAAQLAGFLATLIVGVPAEARWIAELAHYDFRKAAGYLVASVPGMHGCPHPHPQLPTNFQTGISKSNLSTSSNWRSSSAQYLGIVPTSVVGLSHRFCSAADLKGARLRALARILGGLRGDMEGLIPVLLKRARNISADPNAVSVIVYDINSSCEDLFPEQDPLTNYSPTKFLDTGYVQLGFLQKDVAEWIAALWDAGIFSFSACIFPQEALATASGGSNNKVQLILYVFQGQNFAHLSVAPMSYTHCVSMCSLLRSLQRPSGLWRLQEVLSQYKWPDSLETDFLYGSSSIGTSLDAHFLAAFSAAAGKRSIPSAASDESDPEWGCWDAQHESEKPSIGIIFPTIQRVQYGNEGIHAYSRLLCFAESTWERLKSANLLHDAIPYPRERHGFPMHVKVARRRFQFSSNAPSFGWIYCGSHNFSPAAWGRPLFKPSASKAATSAGSVLGSTLRICNYEIGIVFVVPPPEDPSCTVKNHEDLDRYIFPFVVPAPKYQESDRPATTKAMREARIEILKLQQLEETEAGEYLELEEVPDEEEDPDKESCREGSNDGGQQEEEEEKVYAETLWSQLDSYHS